MDSIVESLIAKITMNRLVLYYLVVLLFVSVVFSASSMLPYDPGDIISSVLFLLMVCYVANAVLARIFRVRYNYESTLITAIILSLIIGPVSLAENFFFLTIVGIVAVLSKYLLAIRKRHIFNPAGFAVLFAGMFMTQGASWWIGNSLMQPFIVIGGLLVAYKVRRMRLVVSFLAVYLLLSVLLGISTLGLLNLIIYSPILFFSLVMLTEPLTSPFRSFEQTVYAVLVAVALMVYQVVLRGIPYTLELALLTSNVYGYLAKKKR